MQEKTRYKLEFVLTIVIIIGFLIFKFIPEYKESLGSSDKFLNTKECDGIIEIKINDKPNFMIVTEKNIIRGILFFDNAALCLYNQSIENKTIEEGIPSIIKILIENNYLTASSEVTFVKYTENSYQTLTTVFKNKLQELKVPVRYQDLQLTLDEKAISLDIDISSSSNILREIELYSKEIIRHNKNTESEYEEPLITELTDSTAKELTDNIYKKIEAYVEKNQIINQSTAENTFPITLIPATKEGDLFPNPSSWYYIKDSKVYAYISITKGNKSFSYCYNASIDTYKKGQC